jgi:hypothetical protein
MRWRIRPLWHSCDVRISMFRGDYVVVVPRKDPETVSGNSLLDRVRFRQESYVAGPVGTRDLEASSGKNDQRPAAGLCLDWHGFRASTSPRS